MTAPPSCAGPPPLRLYNIAPTHCRYIITLLHVLSTCCLVFDFRGSVAGIVRSRWTVVVRKRHVPGHLRAGAYAEDAGQGLPVPQKVYPAHAQGGMEVDMNGIMQRWPPGLSVARLTGPDLRRPRRWNDKRLPRSSASGSRIAFPQVALAITGLWLQGAPSSTCRQEREYLSRSSSLSSETGALPPPSRAVT
ncbi:hypothetical protein DENSPDRAFT_355656 [Dentipellis sp. KUC8613]|nr:hypothetical protein DENSPDRAFT_355656 [Dentipellis sp. KUC8613]